MKKIISILLAVLVIGCFGMEAKTTKKSGKRKSSVTAKVKNYSQNNQTTINGKTNFIVDTKVVTIPSLSDFQPLLKHFPKTSRKIKSIKIYYLSGEGGYGALDSDMRYFTKASNIKEAKKYATSSKEFEFNHSQQVEKFDYSFGTDKFKYNEQGNPISIIEEEWGYRGSPEYEVEYTITWKDDNPVSVSRKIHNFFSEYEEPNEDNPPFNLDFNSDPVVSNVLAMLKNNTTQVKTIQNTCRVSGKSIIDSSIFEKGDKVVYWIEAQYY